MLNSLGLARFLLCPLSFAIFSCLHAQGSKGFQLPAMPPKYSNVESQGPLRNFQVSQPPSVPSGVKSCLVPLVHHNFANSYGRPAAIDYTVCITEITTGDDQQIYEPLAEKATHLLRDAGALVFNCVELYGNFQRSEMFGRVHFSLTC